MREEVSLISPTSLLRPVVINTTIIDDDELGGSENNESDDVESEERKHEEEIESDSSSSSSSRSDVSPPRRRMRHVPRLPSSSPDSSQSSTSYPSSSLSSYSSSSNSDEEVSSIAPSSNEVITVESGDDDDGDHNVDDDVVQVIPPPNKRARTYQTEGTAPPNEFRRINPRTSASWNSYPSSRLFVSSSSAMSNPQRTVELIDDIDDVGILEVKTKENNLIDLTNEQNALHLTPTTRPPEYPSPPSISSNDFSMYPISNHFYSSSSSSSLPPITRTQHSEPEHRTSFMDALNIRNQLSALQHFLNFPSFRSSSPSPPPPPKPAEYPTPDSPLDASEDLSAKLTCTICVEKTNEPASTKCGHVFCLACIKRSIQLFRQCPTCRKKLTARDVHRIYL
jgi:hypothetical protein